MRTSTQSVYEKPEYTEKKVLTRCLLGFWRLMVLKRSTNIHITPLAASLKSNLNVFVPRPYKKIHRQRYSTVIIMNHQAEEDTKIARKSLRALKFEMKDSDSNNWMHRVVGILNIFLYGDADYRTNPLLLLSGIGFCNVC